MHRFMLVVLLAIGVFPLAPIRAQSPTAPMRSERTSEFQCPESVGTDSAKRETLNTQIQQFTEKRPKAPLSEFATFRYQLLVSHSCTQTLRYMTGHISPDTEFVRFNGHDYGPKTLVFNPNTKVWTLRLPIRGGDKSDPDSELILNFYGWSEPREPSRVAHQWATAGGGVGVISQFTAPDELSGKPAYFLVSQSTDPDSKQGYVYVSKIAALTTSSYAVTFSKVIPGRGSNNINLNMNNRLLTKDAEGAEEELGNLGVVAAWQERLSQ